MHRVRIQFGKTGPMRFTGHLDLAQAWERLLRRARMPVVYSKGFNPQPRLNLAAALPLGITSECELIDIWLETHVPAVDLLQRLTAAGPPGLTIHSVEEVAIKAPSLQSQLEAAEYDIVLEPLPELEDRVGALLAAVTLPRERRGKSYDLRPLVLSIWPEAQGIGMQLAARPGNTGRADEVLLALGLDALAARIHRTRLIFKPG
jgi:radical SAM-linked protein